MAEWATPEHWAFLRDALGNNTFIRDSILDGVEPTGCALGLDNETKLHLLLRVPDTNHPLPPDLTGITIRYVKYDFLVVDVAADAALEAIVSPVFEAIIRGCLDGRTPLEVIAEELERAKKAFSRAGNEISENKQIGLVGELLVMKYVIIPAIGAEAIFRWSGPLAEKHDFIGKCVHLEVKSTTRSMDQHEISRIDQLKPPYGKRLLLASVQLERSLAGIHTIATLRDEIIAAIQNNWKALKEFDLKMQEMGWHERLVQSGTLLRFNRRALSFFAVEGKFPRLPDDYIPPRGVVSVSYTINVSSCPILPPDEVIALIEQM
jgi:hypothetical protein